MIKLVPPLHETYPITQVFGVNPESYARFGLNGHNGIDYGCPEGTAVYTAAPGKVIKAGYDEDGYGNYIKIDHGGFFTIYAHLSQSNTQVGSELLAGRFIGRSGWTGNVYPPGVNGSHLHFELRINDYEDNGYNGAVDPQPYLDGTTAPVDPQSQNIAVGDAIMVTAGYGLRVRAEPNVTCKFYGYASPGDKFTVKEIIQEGERIWGKVEVFICIEDGNDVYAVKA